MVDTVKLLLNDYSISAHPNLQIQPGLIDAATGEEKNSYILWRSPDGTPVEGSRAFYNGNLLSITLKPHPIEGTGCFLQFSLPAKACKGINYFPLDVEQSKGIFRKVERELDQRVGISTDIKTATICRLDTFKNIETEEPFSSYAPLFAILSAKRMENEKLGATCYLWHNGQHQFTAYDKLKQMRRKQKSDLDRRKYPKNVIRFEHRLLKAPKVRKELGFFQVSDLLENFSELKRAFERLIEENILRYEVTDIEGSGNCTLKYQLRRFKANSGRQWRANSLKAFGLKYLLMIKPMDEIQNAFTEVQGNRMAKSRIKRELEELQFTFRVVEKEESSGRTLGSLYSELKDKVLAA